MKVFKIHVEGILCEFRHVHNSKTFVDGLHAVQCVKTKHNKSNNFRKQKYSSKFHRNKPFNLTRQKFKTFIANLYLDNHCTENVYLFIIPLIWLTAAGQVPCKLHAFCQNAISFVLL